uniref:Putative tail protein n=1 Tax=viral metagenome TaxID=1070528 RepID=A0A6H1ZCV7_9ZZZZ
MADAQAIIDAAARKCGILSLDSNEYADLLADLNNMISLWGLEDLFPYLVSESLALTIGTSQYSIGSGGDIATARAISIKNCFLRNSDGYDYPVESFGADEYNAITLKTSEGRPTKVYYIPEYPLGLIQFNYEPDEAYTAYFDFEKNFTEFAAITTDVDLPNEYKEALIYNFAIRIAENNSVNLPQTVLASASYSKNLLSRSKAINNPPRKAKFDIMTSGYSIDITTGI